MKLSRYLKQEVIETIYKQLNLPIPEENSTDKKNSAANGNSADVADLANLADDTVPEAQSLGTKAKKSPAKKQNANLKNSDLDWLN